MSITGPAGGHQARRAFDLDEALAEIPGGIETACELSALFREEYLQVSEGMRRGLAAGDVEPLRRGAHMLKSSAGIFAAHAAAEAAFRLELVAAGGDLHAAAAALTELERESALLLADLDQHFPPPA